jgi:hypothetical protein
MPAWSPLSVDVIPQDIGLAFDFRTLASSLNFRAISHWLNVLDQTTKCKPLPVRDQMFINVVI